MARVRSLHLTGHHALARFDHEATTIDVLSETVRLASVEQVETTRVDEPVFAAWLARRGGAATVPCRPDGCEQATVLLVERDGAALALRKEGWTPLQIGHGRSASGGPLRFRSALPEAPRLLAEPRALARDPHGRLWLLERGARRILLLAEDDLRLLDTVPFPAGADLVHLACADEGVLAIDGGHGALWLQPYGGEWREVKPAASQAALPPGAVPVAAAGLGGVLVALYRLAAPARWEPNAPDVLALIAFVSGGVARFAGVPGLEDPLPILVLPGGELLIGEVAEGPGDRMSFTRFVTREGRLATSATFGARRFDGRALFLGPCVDGGLEPMVTTATGARPLFTALAAPNQHEGRIETYALDSERYGCVWHRVFLEACVPDGTSIEIAARTSDEITPAPTRRGARPPMEGGLASVDVDRFPLGSRTIDDVEGWSPLGALDRRAAWADVPFAPAAASGIETFEGLVKAPPGRYLWLRVTMRGSRRKTPALAAVRVTFPRPSILDHLPAFWRNDPAAARAMDETLALFEGLLTELDVRIDALPRLFDPGSCPDEALDWLAGFLALVLDRRLDESARRTLVREGAALFRKRGTVPGLTRLLTIVAGARVDLVEAFRQRPQAAAVLGAALDGTGAILGPGLTLGGDANALAGQAPAWEVELAAKHAALMAARREAGDDFGAVLCPAEEPKNPLDPDPFLTLVRRFAHRFTVFVFRRADEELAAILETVIERNKPAHTLHEVCWLDAGFRVGVTTYVGFGTRVGGTETFTPAIVDESPAGTPTVLGRPRTSRTLGMFVGGARLGRTSHLL